MFTPGKMAITNGSFSPSRKTDEQENAELFQFDKTGNISVRYLRESYNAAKARASELNTNAGLSGNLRSHCQQTIRIYSALATLLYSTISISKADDLERFVRKRSLQVPNSLFDIDEWKPVLQIARNVRMGENGKYMDELGAFKSFMRLRLDRLLSGTRLIVNEYKRMKADTSKELDALKMHLEDFRHKVIPHLQKRVTKLEDENYVLLRDNKIFSDAGLAKDLEIKELTRSKSALEREHASHVERVKKESFEAIAFAKSKIETQQSAHQAEVNSLNRQHEAKLEEMRKSFDAQLLHSSVTSNEVISRLTAEREWLQQTHATVLNNADKIQQQFKAQCDNEVKRLEARYAEALESANSRLASESSSTAQLMQSTVATYEAKLSSANAAREYETKMLQVKLDAMEKTLQEAQASLEAAQKSSEEQSAKLLNGEAQLISKRSEIENLTESLAAQRKQHDALKESHDAEFDRLRRQLDALFQEKSALTIELGTIRAERDEVLEGKSLWTKELEKLSGKERALRKQHDELERVVGEMESEKCRLMSYYDEKCLQCDAQKREIAAMKKEKEVFRRRELAKEADIYQQMSDLEADKSRLMGYYDEKCLQSDSYKKKVKQLEDQMARMRKDYSNKEMETWKMMNEIEADKSRLMGYYDEKCLQIGTYKKQLANIEKTIKQQDEASTNALKEELAAFKKQMSLKEMAPVQTVNVKKDATDVVSAISKVVADYTVSKSLADVMSALKAPEKQASAPAPVCREEDAFVISQYTPTRNEEDVTKIAELENIITKKNGEIHSLIAENETKVAEIQSLQNQLLSAESSADKSSSEVSALKDKVNELTKENYYSAAEVTKLTQEVEELKRLNATKSDDDAHQSTTKELEHLKSKLQSLEASTHSRELSMKVLEGELAEQKAMVQKITANNNRSLEENEATIQSQEATISQLKKLVSDLKGSKDDLQSQLDEMKGDPTLNAKIEKLQAITRGFNARARVKRTKMHRDAKTSGVLVATKHTTQGESGWYCAPDGSLYYFVLDGKEWILTCGPITREAFEDTVLNLRPKKVNSGGYLKLSNFDLVTQTVDQPGDLYMSTSTWKLYFAVSVDHLVTENR